MRKMQWKLGIWGLIIFSLLLLAVVCGLALSDPAGMGAILLIVLGGSTVFAVAQRAFGSRRFLLNMRGALGATSEPPKMLLSSAAVTLYTIAKHGADDDHCATASAATDGLLGVFVEAVTAAEQQVAIALDGIVPILYGGAITRGDPLTSDANGYAIKATASGQSIIGFATISGVANDIGFVNIEQQTFYGIQATSGNTFKSLAIATFDATGGAGIGAHGLGVYLPDNAIVVRSWYENLTTFTSATDAATIALGVPTDAASGIKAAVAISNGANAWDAGIVEGLQTGAASAFLTKLTAQRELTATVAVEALTAGKLRLYAEYVVSV